MLPKSLVDDLARFNLKVIEDYDSVSRLSTGSIVADHALGGGLARRRIVEYFGNPSFGKSTMAMVAVAETVNAGGTAIYFDTEGTFDPKWAELLGLPRERFYLIQGVDLVGEDYLNGILATIRSGQFDLIVLDTHDALIFSAEKGIKKKKKDDDTPSDGVGESQIGIHAKILKDFCKKAADSLRATHTCLLLLSQMYSRIGVMYGNPDTATGGKGKEFYASIRVQFFTPETIKEGDEVVGQIFHGKVVKNKTAPPFRDFHVTVRQFFNADEQQFWSVDFAQDLIAMGNRYKVFTNKKGEQRGTSGAYIFGDEDLGGSEKDAIATLRERPDLREKLASVLREKMG